MEMDDETWHLVKEVPKVLGFIGGSSDRPAPITDKEADRISCSVSSEGVGQAAAEGAVRAGRAGTRVIDGPFKDFSGVVETVNYEKSKLAGCSTDSWPVERRSSSTSGR